MAAVTLFSACSSDDDVASTPVEYSKVFSFPYQGTTLYYVVDSVSQSASLVPPLYPNYSTKDGEGKTTL